MQAVLESRGIDSRSVDLSNTVKFDDQYGLDQNFYARLADDFACEVRACGTRIPVITGYFGPVPGGLLNNVGRGYTDLCAALVAVGLNAKELQIWKEVDGVFTAVRRIKFAGVLSRPLISWDSRIREKSPPRRSCLQSVQLRRRSLRRWNSL